MTRESYYHRALFAPIAVLLAGALLFALTPTRFSWGAVVFLGLHAVVGVPYLLLALLLRWWTRAWPGARLARAATTLPLLVAPLAGLAVAIIWLLFDPPQTDAERVAWSEGGGLWFVVGALVSLAGSYAYVGVVRLGDRLRRNARVVRAWRTRRAAPRGAA